MRKGKSKRASPFVSFLTIFETSSVENPTRLPFNKLCINSDFGANPVIALDVLNENINGLSG